MQKREKCNDPILLSLLDTDFYKFLMLQLIHGVYPDVKVKFTLIDRSSGGGLAKEIDETVLREQLDHARTLRFTEKEISWLAGHVFQTSFLNWLKDFQLPEYNLRRVGKNYILEFSGLWMQASMWEVPALSIVSELKGRSALQSFGAAARDVVFDRAKTTTYEKILRLKKLSAIRIADFGTRRRHSFAWQCWCSSALHENMGAAFVGTSNVRLAMKQDWQVVGTNGHELPMVLAALSCDDTELKKAPYQVLKDWSRYYRGDMLIVLPDAFGTDFFLRYAPDYVAQWKGFRIDSGCAINIGERILKWWAAKGVDPREKTLLFSDNLDVSTIEKIYWHFEGKVKTIFGWGTNLTNDFDSIIPGLSQGISSALVCKITEANGKDVVKLSDDLAKATGKKDQIERYLRVFRV